MNAQTIIDLFGTAITYVASAVVWLTLLAGLYQLVRSGIHRIRLAVADTRAGTHTSRRYLGTASTDASGELTQHV